MNRKHNVTRTLQARAGFSLVELMVAVLAGSFAVMAVYYLGGMSARAFNEQMRVSESQASLRSAMEQVRRDISRAGYYASSDARLLTPCSEPAGVGGASIVSAVQVQAIEVDTRTPAEAPADVRDLLAGHSAAPNVTRADVLRLWGNYATADAYLVNDALGTSASSVILQMDLGQLPQKLLGPAGRSHAAHLQPSALQSGLRPRSLGAHREQWRDRVSRDQQLCCGHCDHQLRTGPAQLLRREGHGGRPGQPDRIPHRGRHERRGGQLRAGRADRDLAEHGPCCCAPRSTPAGRPSRPPLVATRSSSRAARARRPWCSTTQWSFSSKACRHVGAGFERVADGALDTLTDPDPLAPPLGTSNPGSLRAMIVTLSARTPEADIRVAPSMRAGVRHAARHLRPPRGRLSRPDTGSRAHDAQRDLPAELGAMTMQHTREHSARGKAHNAAKVRCCSSCCSCCSWPRPRRPLPFTTPATSCALRAYCAGHLVRGTRPKPSRWSGIR